MIRQRLGWIPDIPDFRDYSGETPVVRDLMAGARRRPGLPPQRAGGGGRPAGASEPLPPAVDLRSHCSPVEDQENLGSCTANAGTGIIEYYERRAFGRHLEASRLFLYKAARNLMKISGDTGAYLRTTIGAMVLFGVPPEDYWPYDDRPDRFDREPPAFCYAFAQNYKTIRYYRHDVPGTPAGETLDRVKTHLAAGHPSMFGFTVYGSIEAAGGDGAIPSRDRGSEIEGVGTPWPRSVMTTGSRSGTKKRRGRNDRSPPHPQFLGKGMGGRRVRLAAVRLRPPRPGRGFLVRLEEGLDRHRRLRRVSRPDFSSGEENSRPEGRRLPGPPGRPGSRRRRPWPRDRRLRRACLPARPGNRRPGRCGILRRGRRR